MFLLHFTDKLVCVYLCSVITYRVSLETKKKCQSFFSTQAPCSNIRTFIHQIKFPCTTEVKIG